MLVQFVTPNVTAVFTVFHNRFIVPGTCFVIDVMPVVMLLLYAGDSVTSVSLVTTVIILAYTIAAVCWSLRGLL